MPKMQDAAKLRWYHGLTGYQYLVLIVAALGWMFDTMDQWLYVLARQPALEELLANANPEMAADALANLVRHNAGILNAIFIVGWATGGFLFGMIGDKLGRTVTMAITVLMYAVFTGLSGLSWNYESLAVFRFLTGLGIGGEFAAGASLVAEVFPQHARAAALGIMQAASAVGNVMAGAIAYVVAVTGGNIAVEGGIAGWRILFFVGLAPALLVFVIRLFVKEPEKWHQAKADAKAGQIRLGTISHLFTESPWLRNTLVGVGLAAVGVVGFWGIGSFAPDLARAAAVTPAMEDQVAAAEAVLEVAEEGSAEAAAAKGVLAERKLAADKGAALAVMLQNSGAFFGILLWAWLAERIGRKWTFAMTFLACLVVVPGTFHITAARDTFATVVLLYPILGFTTTALFGGYAVYFPELFPTRLRATGTGFCYNVARYIAAAGPWLFGSLDKEYGKPMAATILSTVFILGILILPFGPETKGKPLPE